MKPVMLSVMIVLAYGVALAMGGRDCVDLLSGAGEPPEGDGARHCRKVVIS